MSVYQIMIGERALRGMIADTYAVEAENAIEASEFALGYHATSEHIHPDDLLVMEVTKTVMRCVLHAERITTQGEDNAVI